MASQKKLIEDEKQREDQIKGDREMAERMSYDMTKKFLPGFCVPEPQKEMATNGNSTSGNNTCSDTVRVKQNNQTEPCVILKYRLLPEKKNHKRKKVILRKLLICQKQQSISYKK